MQNFNKKTIIIGYSGHGLVVADSAIDCGYNLIGYCDLEKKDLNPFKIKYLGNEIILNLKFFSNDYQYIIGIGDNKIRTKIFKFLISKSANIISVIHPKASVSSTVKVNSGTFISKNSSVNAMCNIGSNIILNTGSIIEHDCIISNNVHVAPGAIVLGNVKIGEASFIGAGSTIKEGLQIGKNVLIGAGSLVLKNIPDNSLFYGNPRKIIK